MKYANIPFNELQINGMESNRILLEDILRTTIPKPLVNEDKKIINSSIWDIEHNTRYIVRNLWYLGFIDTKIVDGLFILSDRGLQFLLWMRENCFEMVVDAVVFYNAINYIKLLIPAKDLALALSITSTPKRLLSLIED